MIFKHLFDIQSDIKNKVILYYNHDKNIEYIFSLMNSYLKELQHIKEIDNYSTFMENKEFNIRISKNDEVIDFNIDVISENRLLKINKINSCKIEK